MDKIAYPIQKYLIFKLMIEEKPVLYLEEHKKKLIINIMNKIIK